MLPLGVPEPERWIAAALRQLAIKYGRFPVVGQWWNEDRWQTSTEAVASRELKRLKNELARMTKLHEDEIAATELVLGNAGTDASVGPRRLLTEKGSPLAAAVDATLGALGYRVTDVDREALHDAAGKAADFRVADPDDPTFDPLIEVKGYDRGAKAGDVSKLLRNAIRATKAGDAPSALWWIINHLRLHAPDDRARPLDNEKALVDEHAAEEPPLVIIDTRHLFKALRAVEDGSATPSEVRASLRSARGWWSGLPDRRVGRGYPRDGTARACLKGPNWDLRQGAAP